MSHDRAFPPGIVDIDDLVAKVEASTSSTVKRRRGDEIVLSPCPLGGCKGDKFSIHSEKGAWNCPKCGEKGNAWTLVECLNLGPVKPAFPAAIRKRTRRTKRIKQSEVDRVYERHVTELDSSPRVLAELGRRGISRDTCRAWGLCASGDEVGFTYRRSNGSIAFIKFKNIASGKQRRWPTKDQMPAPVETPLYSHSSFDPTEDTVVTEGEWDALSFWQSGIYSVVSIAGGCSMWDDVWTKTLAPCPAVYLAYDQDLAGEKGLLLPAQALGREVCYRVVLGSYKDASDALQGGWSNEEFLLAIENARRLRPEILRSLPEMAHDLAERMRDGDAETRIDTGFAHFDRTQRGLRTGEFSVLTANTGMGKTTWTLDLSLRLAEGGEPALYVSMEQTPEATVGQLLSMLAECPLEDMTPEGIKRAAQGAPPQMFLAVEPERDRVAQVVQTIRYARLVHGVRVVVVDHLDYLIEPIGREARHEAAGRAVRELHAVARNSNVHVILICQPTSGSGRSKNGDARQVRFEDIAETRLATQLPHNGWVWSSDKGTRIGRLYVRKARHNAAQEEVTIEFKFGGFRFSEVAARTGRPR